MGSKFESLWAMSVAVVLILGVVVVIGCAAPEKADEEMTAEMAGAAAEAEAEEEMVEYLFVQHAEGVTLADGVLTLAGIGEDVLYFSDRPSDRRAREPRGVPGVLG